MNIEFKVTYEWGSDYKCLFYTINLFLPETVPDEYTDVLKDWIALNPERRKFEKVGSVLFSRTPERTVSEAQLEARKVINNTVESLKRVRDKMNILCKEEFFKYII